MLAPPVMADQRAGLSTKGTYQCWHIRTKLCHHVVSAALHDSSMCMCCFVMARPPPRAHSSTNLSAQKLHHDVVPATLHDNNICMCLSCCGWAPCAGPPVVADQRACLSAQGTYQCWHICAKLRHHVVPATLHDSNTCMYFHVVAGLCVLALQSWRISVQVSLPRACTNARTSAQSSVIM